MRAAILIAVSLVIAGCSGVSKDQIAKVLKENPEILFEAMGSKPEELAKVMQKASSEMRKLAQARAKKQREEQMAADLKQPKQANLAGRIPEGNKDADKVIVMYSDMQCPYCSRGFQTVNALKKKYGKDLRVYYKHLPLDFHPMAMPAAQRFEALMLQSPKKAFKFHEMVYSNQDKLKSGGEKFLDKAVKDVGGNLAKVKTDMKTDKVKKLITADTEEARKFGIRGTPGFLVNGVSLRGAQPAAAFESVFEQRPSYAARDTASKSN